MSDEEILEKIRRGGNDENSAFEEILARPKLQQAIVNGYGGVDREEIKNRLHDVLIVFRDKVKSPDEEEIKNITGFVLRAFQFQMKSYFRNQTKGKGLMRAKSTFLDELAPAEELSESQHELEPAFARQDAIKRLYHFFGDEFKVSNPTCWELLQLRHELDMLPQEIAPQRGFPSPGACRKKIFSCLRKVRQWAQDQGLFESLNIVLNHD